MANKKTIITIGRQFGSGGHEIGATIAQDLGINLYDKEMLKRAAKESGLCEELFETHDEKPTYSFLYSLVMDTYSFGNYAAAPFLDMPLNHKVFLAAFDAIKSVADQGPCVIVGRIADYVLRNHQPLVSVFITADMDDRVKRIMEYENIDAQQAANLIKKVDKMRSSYYNFYSEKTWGSADSYQLCINTSKVGIEAAAQLVMQYVEKICANSAK